MIQTIIGGYLLSEASNIKASGRCTPLTLKGGASLYYRKCVANGDDDQSIYGFRGSDPQIMQDFKGDFPEAGIVKLNVNYRSHPEIVNAAGRIISENTVRIDKDIVSGQEEIAGGGDKEWPDVRVDIRGFKDRDEELAAFRNCFSPEAGIKKALLLRTNELMSFYAEKLSMLNIAFSCNDRIKNIYDHFIARDILSYLAFAEGDRSRNTFFQIMNRPYRGISRNAARDNKVDLNEVISFHRGDLRTLASVNRFVNDIRILSGMKPYPAVHYILKGMGYEKYLLDMAKEKNMDAGELIKTAEEIKQRAGAFRSFYEWNEAILDYRRELEILQRKEGREEDKPLSLATMHGSKGLEYDEVFLFDVNETIIPYHRAVLPEEIEEERRLFYVAATRAKSMLHIWYIMDNMGKHMEPSRFDQSGDGSVIVPKRRIKYAKKSKKTCNKRNLSCYAARD